MKKILHILFSLSLLVALQSPLSAQCNNNVLSNGSFESGSTTDWWSWHDNSPNAYTFGTSADAVDGDSSAVINVVDISAIVGGQGAEYNSRPQTNPVTGGEWYEIRFFAKSTRPDTRISIYVKDENTGWTLLHQDLTHYVGTDWTEVTSLWKPDIDRADVHLELKVYNETFDQPYSVWFDAVSICNTQVLTNTCSDNVVANPGFEEGAFNNWWTWHGGEATDYGFEEGTTGYLGAKSARINVLKPSAQLSGAGEFNSRPQVSPVTGGQNYKVSLAGISTLPNTVLQLWVKDEYDGWTTIGNSDLTFGTEWSVQSFVFTADVDRADVHVEVKVFNADFNEPYSVWFDEVSVCKTDEEPGGGGGGGDPIPPIFGDAVGSDCNNNLVPGYDGFEDPANAGWDIWDGSDSDVLSTFNLDPVLPHTGGNSMRIDVNENHNVAEFHHRFGEHLVLEDGKEYMVTLWMRANVQPGDTAHIYTRAVRDTDWDSQFAFDMMVTSNTWLNFDQTFVADGNWNNAFLEMKAWRKNGFTYAYSVWYDDIEVCKIEDAVVDAPSVAKDQLGLVLAPNPVSGANANLTIAAPRNLEQVQVVLTDLLGRSLWLNNMDLVAGDQTVSLPTQGLQSGFYLVSIRYEGFTETRKLQVINH